MFEHGLKKIYLPQKAHFLDSKDSRFNHQHSFGSLDERIRLSYVGKQDGTLLKNALERTIKDTAKRILQTDYAVRGYEPPKQEKKKSRSITM